MLSERSQRHIDRLLDEADKAMAQRDWPLLRQHAEDVLLLDADNQDAHNFLTAAERALSAAAPRPAPSAAPPPPQPTAQGAAIPASFAAGRYEVKRFLGEGGKKRVYLRPRHALDRDVAFALIKTEGLDDDGRERDHARGAGHGPAGRPSAHRHRLRARRRGRPAVHRHRADGRRRRRGRSSRRRPTTAAAGAGAASSPSRCARGWRSPTARASSTATSSRATSGSPPTATPSSATSAWPSPPTARRLTQAGMMVGTVRYMPPEQAMGGEVTPQSDLYSLGCDAVRAGHRPAAVRRATSSVAIIGQHLNTPPGGAVLAPARLPAGAGGADPAPAGEGPGKRPASAAEVVEALAAVGAAPARTPSQAAPAATLPSGSDNPVYRRIFVGREAELRQLEAAFDAAASGQGGLVMVVGEPGIGKTTLTEQLHLRRPARRPDAGGPLLRGRLALAALPALRGGACAPTCWSGSPTQLAQRAGQRRAGRGAHRERGARPGAGQPLGAAAGDPGEDRYRLLNAVGGFLRNAAAVQPLVLVLEDLHDADRGTLDLLQHSWPGSCRAPGCCWWHLPRRGGGPRSIRCRRRWPSCAGAAASAGWCCAG